MALDNFIDNLKSSSHLGKKTRYASSYAPELLFAVARQPKRAELGITEKLPFSGADIWNAYELSWLNEKGKPLLALANIIVPCTTPNIFESKSLKLYFNSFNNSTFKNQAVVQTAIEKDLSNLTGGPVKVKLAALYTTELSSIGLLPGQNIDHLDVSIDTYQTNSDFLATEDEMVSEALNSDLLKSNCLITNQPDWGSVYIRYSGHKIKHAGLLQYIISMRNHNEFHEQCVERIFIDIIQRCQPTELTVYARYTRRGGIDINPFRTTDANLVMPNTRLVRQ